MDEVDGLGPSTYNGTQTGPEAERFWKFMGVVIGRVYKLFAKGWPGGVLPTWHVGAVEVSNILTQVHPQLSSSSSSSPHPLLILT